MFFVVFLSFSKPSDATRRLVFIFPTGKRLRPCAHFTKNTVTDSNTFLLSANEFCKWKFDDSFFEQQIPWEQFGVQILTHLIYKHQGGEVQN
jgi:hypothetical protein